MLAVMPIKKINRDKITLLHLTCIKLEFKFSQKNLLKKIIILGAYIN